MKYPGAEVRKECITKNGLSVTEATRILHVGRRNLSNLLNGRSGISVEIKVEPFSGTNEQQEEGRE